MEYRLNFKRMVTKESLKKAIELSSGINFEVLKIKNRIGELKIWRQFYYYYSLNYRLDSSVAAGLVFGQSHATVLHGKKYIQNLISLGYSDIIEKKTMIETYLKAMFVNEEKINEFIDKIQFNALNMSQDYFRKYLKSMII